MVVEHRRSFLSQGQGVVLFFRPYDSSIGASAGIAEAVRDRRTEGATVDERVLCEFLPEIAQLLVAGRGVDEVERHGTSGAVSSER